MKGNSSNKSYFHNFPENFVFSQNYPNPFNTTTIIKYQLLKTAKVKITIYNILGEKIKTLIDKKQNIGEYTIQWDGTDDFGQNISSRVYIIRLKSDNFISSKKVLYIK